MFSEPSGALDDLLNIEINTILKSNMTAEKAPSIPFALLDIIESYGSWLAEELRVDLEPYFELPFDICKKTVRAHKDWKAADPADRDETSLWLALENAWKPPSGPKTFSMGRRSNGWDSFERLRIAATDALDPKKHMVLTDKNRVMLTRITRSCAQLKYIVWGLQQQEHEEWKDFVPKNRQQLQGAPRKRVPLRSVELEDRITIRKIWEMGTEVVVAQTCVSLDGDVVTRLSPDLFSNHGNHYNAEIRDILLRIHRDSTSLGVQHWQALVDTVMKITTAAGSFFARMLGRGK
jgi:hypothetical protein